MRGFCWVWIGVLWGCTSPASQYRVYDARHDVFRDVEIPTLEDPRRLIGTYARGIKGGYISPKQGLRPGMALDIRFSVVDGVNVAADQDGMYLWAAYDQIENTIGELDDLGVDTSLFHPFQIAYAPALSEDSTFISNAFWICNVGTEEGPGTMGVLPQGDPAGPAFVTHPGVVRHEFGHNIFGSLFGGTYAGCTPYGNDLRAANEGFSDLVAATTTDDAAWNTPVLEERGLDLDHVQTESMKDSDALIYEYGSVLAAYGWDLRRLSTSEDVLRFAMDAVSEMGRLPADAEYSAPPWMGAYILTRVVEAYPEARDEGCTQFGVRFPLEPAPGVCAS